MKICLETHKPVMLSGAKHLDVSGDARSFVRRVGGFRMTNDAPLDPATAGLGEYL